MTCGKRSLFFALVLGGLAAGEICALDGGAHPVRARLLADVAAVEPGNPFHLGVQLRMEEGWHTYWEFGGDAGKPTEIEWDLPPGFSAGPLQWPLPSKYTEAGDLVVYGYSDENLLQAKVQGPGDGALAATPLKFGATVSWLVCRESCIPGDTSLVLELPVSREKRTSVHAELFALYRARVPRPLEQSEGIKLDYVVQGKGEGIQVDVVLEHQVKPLKVGPSTPDFYPSNAAESFDFEPVQRLQQDGSTSAPEEGHGGALLLRLGLQPYGAEDIQVLQGVLVYHLEGEEEVRYGTVELDLGSVRASGSPGLLAMDFHLEGEDQAPFSLGFYLLLAGLGGLILNLMPCVLPVISLKVLGFVSQAGEERGRIRQLGLAFAAGIVATFLGLAALVVLLKSGGEQIGWGFQFHYPGFVMAMAALVFALGLSLFGVFTVRLPGGQGTLGGVAGREGLISSFANGVLATILATPCTAPFLGTALGFAFSRSAGIIWGVFFCIGLGMALPYILLALEPAWMRFLPKPGVWMERFKQFMGFLLMATVLWLLWVLGKQVGMEGVVWTKAFLLCLALSCWILGQWVDLRSTTRKRVGGWIAALAFTGAGYSAFLQPLLEEEHALAAMVPESEDGLDWQPFSVERIEGLVAAGQNVFINFTAEWCWTCKVNERTVLTDAVVRAKFAEMDMALIKADWTNRNPEITALLQAFGRSGVPLYVILPGGRADRPIVLPEVITTGLVVEKLEEAAVAR